MDLKTRWVTRVVAAAGLAIGLYAAAGTTGAAPGTITLCYADENVRPWRYSKGGGLNFQLLENAAGQAALSLRYEAMSWSRCLARLRDNEVSGVFSADFRSELLVYGAYPGGTVPDVSKRLHADQFVLLRRRDDSLGWDGKSLSRLSGALGTLSGYALGEQLRRLGAEITEEAAGADDLVRELAAGRLAGAVLLGGEASRVLEHNPEFRRQVEVLPVPLIEKSYYLMLSHAFVQSRPHQADQLWRGIEQARASAAYRLLERRTLAALGQN